MNLKSTVTGMRIENGPIAPATLWTMIVLLSRGELFLCAKKYFILVRCIRVAVILERTLYDARHAVTSVNHKERGENF